MMTGIGNVGAQCSQLQRAETTFDGVVHEGEGHAKDMEDRVMDPVLYQNYRRPYEHRATAISISEANQKRLGLTPSQVDQIIKGFIDSYRGAW